MPLPAAFWGPVKWHPHYIGETEAQRGCPYARLAFWKKDQPCGSKGWEAQWRQTCQQPPVEGCQATLAHPSLLGKVAELYLGSCKGALGDTHQPRSAPSSRQRTFAHDSLATRLEIFQHFPPFVIFTLGEEGAPVPVSLSDTAAGPLCCSSSARASPGFTVVGFKQASSSKVTRAGSPLEALPQSSCTSLTAWLRLEKLPMGVIVLHGR